MSKIRIIFFNTRADAVVEAAILFPVMIVVFSALVMLALYLPARSALQRATQYAATAIATECSDSWLYVDEKTTQYNWKSSKHELENVYSAMLGGNIDALAKGGELVALVEADSISSKAGELSVVYSIVNRIIYKEVIVTAARVFKPPINLSLFGIPNSLAINVTSTAVIQDADEFIRNVDLSIDFAQYISDRFDLKDITSSISTIGADIISLIGRTSR